MRRTGLLACIIIALGLAGCATPSNTNSRGHDQTSASAAGLDPVQGTVFLFDDGRVERFVRRDGDALIWATRRGREYVRAANPAVPILAWRIGTRTGRREVFGAADAIWPPRNGARAQFRVLTEVEDGPENRRYSQAWSCEVNGPQTITVPAGAFAAYQIICERFSVNSMRLLQRRTWWWSEDLGHYVRRRYQNLRNGEVTDFSLCAALPDRRASAARLETLLEDCRA